MPSEEVDSCENQRRIELHVGKPACRQSGQNRPGHPVSDVGSGPHEHRLEHDDPADPAPIATPELLVIVAMVNPITPHTSVDRDRFLYASSSVENVSVPQADVETSKAGAIR